MPLQQIAINFPPIPVFSVQTSSFVSATFLRYAETTENIPTFSENLQKKSAPVRKCTRADFLFLSSENDFRTWQMLTPCQQNQTGSSFLLPLPELLRSPAGAAFSGQSPCPADPCRLRCILWLQPGMPAGTRCLR